jgi:spermidine/putrescine ABC transporter ATP-binding subunit
MTAAPPGEAPDVELVRVTKRFGDVVAVDGVDVAVRRGEFFSLLGPSGCGKTTMLRMVAGFEHPTAGEVRIRGVLANEVPPYRRPTNLVFQQLALFPHMDVFDNVGFGLRMHRLPRPEIRRKVLAALELVQLAGLEGRRIRQLSGGQQQRVAIARALVNEPAVLLLDEPLGSLDARLRVQMQLELKGLQNRLGTTFLYVTHDQSEALTMSDRVAVIRQGRVEQVGTPRDVYLRPATAFVAAFIGDSNLLDARVVERTSEETVVDVDGLGRCVVATGPAPGPPAAAGTLLVRPEHVRLGRDAEACRNRFRGRVVESIFQGPVVRTVFQLPSGRRLVAHASLPGGVGAPPGAELPFGWEPADNVLVGLP